MQDCIFCKIVRGEIPSFKIAENEKAFAFLDINPVVQGHSLVVPKKHFENVFDTPEAEVAEVLKLSKKIAEKLRKNLNADGVNITHSSGKAAQQDIMHLHFHVIPRFENDGLNVLSFKKKEEGLKLEEIAERLRE